MTAYLLIPIVVALTFATPRPGTAQDVAPESRALRKLPVHVLVDFGHLMTRTPLMTLALGGALAAAAHPGDVSTALYRP